MNLIRGINYWLWRSVYGKGRLDRWLSLVAQRRHFHLAKLLLLSAAVVVVETTNAKLRLFRVPDLLSAAFVLAALALLSTFLFQ